MPPNLGYLSQVQIQLFLGLHELKAFSVRLHQTILHAVMHHLNKVP